MVSRKDAIGWMEKGGLIRENQLGDSRRVNQ